MTPSDPLKAEAERLYHYLRGEVIGLVPVTVREELEAALLSASHRGAQEALRAAADATGEMIDSLAVYPCDYIHTGEIKAWLRDRADALAEPTPPLAPTSETPR